jgi:hemerythrin superfamily protein
MFSEPDQRKDKLMNAIDLLESQHREVEELFSKIEGARRSEKKAELFDKLADNLAIHAAIEEHHFYPAVKERRTEDILLESLEEHLAIKRVLADLLDMDVEDEKFDAKVTVLKEEIEHHVKEEEKELFPKVKKLFNEEELTIIAQAMTEEQEELEQEGEPRWMVPSETERSASI